MTAAIPPGKSNTRSGRPVAAGRSAAGWPSLTVNIDQITILRDAVGGISIQPLGLDPELGETVFLATLSPGCVLPVRYHTGPAEVYRFSGRWAYREYPNLWSNSLVFRSDDVLVTNLSLDVGAVTPQSLPTVDGPWAAAVKLSHGLEDQETYTERSTLGRRWSSRRKSTALKCPATRRRARASRLRACDAR